MHPFLTAIERGCPRTDHYVAGQALQRRADLQRIIDDSHVVGLESSVEIHDSVLRTIADRYGHVGPLDEALLQRIMV